MSLQGNLRTMELADILQWASAGQKDGTLIVRSATGITKKVFFKEGKVLSAACNDPKEYLGHFLISHGYLTEDQLNMAMQTQLETKVMLGRILVQCGLIEETDLAAMLRLKVRETIYSLFLWTEGDFHFAFDPIDADKLVPVHMELMSLIMEGVRRRDEFKRISAAFPSDRTVLRKTARRIKEDALHPQSILKKAYDLIDGNRSLEELMLELHAQPFELYSNLYKFFQKGLLEVAGEKQDPMETVRSTLRERMVPQIREAIGSGEYHQARNLIQYLLKTDPANPDAKVLLDECAAAEDAATAAALDRAKVPELLKKLQDLAGENLTPQEGFLLTRINGTWSVQEILKITPIPEKEALRSFKKLLDSGIISLR